MKKIYQLFTVALVIILFSACHKDKNTLQSGPITGKWQETKLNIHITVGTTTNADTTLTGVNFTSADYYQFNADNTAVISQSGSFGITGKTITIQGGSVYIWLNHYDYNIVGSTLNLVLIDAVPQPLNGNVLTTSPNTIIQIDNTHLILKNSFNYISTPQGTNGPVVQTTTAYFTKTN
jgi:hypothetical protein